MIDFLSDLIILSKAWAGVAPESADEDELDSEAYRDFLAAYISDETVARPGSSSQASLIDVDIKFDLEIGFDEHPKRETLFSRRSQTLTIILFLRVRSLIIPSAAANGWQPSTPPSYGNLGLHMT